MPALQHRAKNETPRGWRGAELTRNILAHIEKGYQGKSEADSGSVSDKRVYPDLRHSFRIADKQGIWPVKDDNGAYRDLFRL